MMGTFLSTMPIMMIPIECCTRLHLDWVAITFHVKMSAFTRIKPYELFFMPIGCGLQKGIPVSYCGSTTQLHQQYHRTQCFIG